MPERTSLDDVLAETVQFASRSLGEGVRIEVRPFSSDLAVTADHEQLLQALTALVVNAAEAMPHGGCVELACEPAHPSRVTISVSDTGRGLPSELQAHLFEPFVTNRSDRWGAGLGLALAHGIVTQHGGTIEVASREEGGTVVRVALPRALGDASGVRRWAELAASQS